MNKIEIVDGERVMTLPDGSRIRPDRFVTSDMEGHTTIRASDPEADPPPATDDELRALFHPDLLRSAGIPAAPPDKPSGTE